MNDDRPPIGRKGHGPHQHGPLVSEGSVNTHQVPKDATHSPEGATQSPNRLIRNSHTQRPPTPRNSPGEGEGRQKSPETPATGMHRQQVRSQGPPGSCPLTGRTGHQHAPQRASLPPTHAGGCPQGVDRGVPPRAEGGAPQGRSPDDAASVSSEGSDGHGQGAQKVEPPGREGSTRRPPLFSAKPKTKSRRGVGGYDPSEGSASPKGAEGSDRSRVLCPPRGCEDPPTRSRVVPLWARMTLAASTVAAFLIGVAHV